MLDDLKDAAVARIKSAVTGANQRAKSAAGTYLDDLRWTELIAYLTTVAGALKALCAFLALPEQATNVLMSVVVGAIVLAYLRNPKRKPWIDAPEGGASEQ